MRKMIFLGTFLLVPVMHTEPASAGPWCVWYDAYTYNCGFQTLEQCRATASGDSHAWCGANIYEPSRPQNRDVPATRRRKDGLNTITTFLA